MGEEREWRCGKGGGGDKEEKTDEDLRKIARSRVRLL